MPQADRRSRKHWQCQAGRRLAAQCHTRTANPRWPVLLRHHVDAAGALDRLLRRSRLRPSARRRDAGGDARLWRVEPSDLRLGALGSTMQTISLALYLPFDGLVSLYVISATFGMAQGGLVPSYAAIIRELFPGREAGLRVSLAISTTLAGMALGGWLAGAIYDWTGSYAAALVNGIAWNLVTTAIAFWLLHRKQRRATGAPGRAAGRA